MTIWTLGDAVVDLLPRDNMQFEACAGGAPFNVAIGVAASAMTAALSAA